MTTELNHILQAHAKKYPLMAPCDAVKLIYQNEFGGGHLVTDSARSLARLRFEYDSVPHDGTAPLLEEIGNGLVRVMLGALLPDEYSLEALNEDFVRSAAEHSGSKATFLEKLELLRTMTRQGAFPFTPQELEEYLTSYISAGCPMVSHSEGYRAAYRPAYRVILRCRLPLFLETERLILRKFKEEDFADFWAYANDPEMCRMMGRDDMSRPETARFTFDWLKDREERGYALVLKENRWVIGNLTITLPSPSAVELRKLAGKKGRAMSFSLSRQYQRRGLMEEALRAVIAHLFEAEEMDYINLGHFDFNHASRDLQKKLGFSQLTTERFSVDGTEFVVMENILWKE